MTMMKILETKGYLKKSGSDRAHVYEPSQPKQQVIRGMVREFVNRVFNGSAEPLLMHLVEDEGLTEKDLAEIARTARRRKS
jgi:predicted transcriptional regulator